MNTFEQNFSTFDKFKFSNEADEKPNSFTNFPEDKTKKGLSDLTNILKSQKPNIPLKNKKNDGDTRIHVEIANIHYEIINKIQSSNSNALQALLPDQNSLDPISQLQELLQIVCSMASGKGKLKGNSNELTEEECKNYENLLQKLEGEIRNHIGIQQQLRLYGEGVQSKLDDYEKNQDLKKISPAMEQKIKKDNALKREELKKKQMEIDNLTKELLQKNEMIKMQNEKIKNGNNIPEKAPFFQNAIIEQRFENKKLPQNSSKIFKTSENNELATGEAFPFKENRRKTSLSSVSGSNRSIQTHNSLKSNFEFVDKTSEPSNKREPSESSFLKKNLDGLSEKEKGIIEYFQSKLNERDEQVNFLQNQIKSLMNTNRQTDRRTNDSDEDYHKRSSKPIPTNESKRNDIKQKSISNLEKNLEKAYLATDRFYPRERENLENERSLITTDRNYSYHHKNASFHQEANKDLNKSKIRMNEDSSNNIKANKHLLQEKSQKILKNNSNNNITNHTSSSNQLKTSFLNQKNSNKDLNNEVDDELNSKYFLKASKGKSPIKQDYKNYEINGEKKRDLSAIGKNFSETQRVTNEHNYKNIDGKKGSYIDFLNKNRNYLFQD